jgi:hypothetical protein
MNTVTCPSPAEFHPTAHHVTDAVAAYLHQSLSNNTHRAYEQDLHISKRGEVRSGEC